MQEDKAATLSPDTPIQTSEPLPNTSLVNGENKKQPQALHHPQQNSCHEDASDSIADLRTALVLPLEEERTDTEAKVQERGR